MVLNSPLRSIFAGATLLMLASGSMATTPVSADRGSAEYRALSQAFGLLGSDAVEYTAENPQGRLAWPARWFVVGSAASATLQGPRANPWNTEGDYTAREVSAAAAEAPWGGILLIKFFAYQPKLDKVTNPYQDPDGNPARLCWLWSYPSHRATVCAWLDAEVDQDAMTARVRPIAEALHRGMVEAGLAGAAAAAAVREYRAIIEWPPLQPGEWLTPSARFVDQDGRPPVEPQSIVWRIGGRETPSIQWDGSEVVVELQASVGHQALMATRTLPAWGAAADAGTSSDVAGISAAADPANGDSGPALAPLPGPLGWLPLPETWTQALTSLLAPAAVVWIGSLLGWPGGGRAPIRPPAAKATDGTDESTATDAPEEPDTPVTPDSRAPNPNATLPISSLPIYTTAPPVEAHQAFGKSLASSIAAQSGHFSKATWEAAGDTEREQWTQQLLDQMQGTLKLTKPVRLEFENRPEKSYAGYYSDQDPAGPKVVVNKPGSDFATRPGEVIDTIAHEIRHACQWDAKRPLESQEVRDVCDANHAAGAYVTPEQDFPSYMEQFVEKDATAFAGAVRGALMTQIYVDKLETLLQSMAALEPKKTTAEQIQAFLWENPQHKAAIKQAWASGKLVIKGMPKPP
jgi:hypothetical protein